MAGNTFDAQSGHSRQTSFNRYAKSNKQITNITPERLDEFLWASEKLQSWLELPVDEAASVTKLPNSGPGTSSTPHSSAQSIIHENIQPPTLEISPGSHPASDLRVSLSKPTLASMRQSITSLETLRQVFKDSNARFRSKYQHQAANAVLHQQLPVFVILPTAGGKSILFWLATFFFTGKTVLVVVPLVSLQRDMIDRAVSLGFKVCGHVDDYNGHQVIVSTYESATSNSSLEKLHRLSSQGLLSRIFLDEIHTFVTDRGYRPQVRLLTRLGTLGVPLVFLTATAPDHIVDSIVRSFVEIEGIIVVRAPTNRNNLCYEVFEGIPDLDIGQKVAVLSRDLEPSGRILVFFNKISRLEAFARILHGLRVKAVSFFSDLDTKESNVTDWITGVSTVMLCSSAFGLGIDFPSVRNVLMIDLPYSFEDFVQQSGRAGRDGLPSAISVYWRSEDGRVGAPSQSFLNLMNFVQSSTCRRGLISSYMDGTETSCYFEGDNTELCDNCMVESRSPFTQVVVPRSMGGSGKLQDIVDFEECLKLRLRLTLQKLIGKCPCCHARNLFADHRLQDCDFVVGRCLACLEKGHFGKSCTRRKKLRNTSVGDCYLCYFPSSAHEDKKSCPSDFAVPFSLTLFHLRSVSLGPINNWILSKYYSWLFEKSANILNCVHLVLQTPLSKLSF